MPVSSVKLTVEWPSRRLTTPMSSPASSSSVAAVWRHPPPRDRQTGPLLTGSDARPRSIGATRISSAVQPDEPRRTAHGRR